MVHVLDQSIVGELVCKFRLVIHFLVKALEEMVQLVAHLNIPVLGQVHEFGDLLLNFHAKVLASRNANVFPAVATVQAALHVHVVISDNSQDQIRGRNAVGPLCCHELACLFDRRVDIVASRTRVGDIIMGYEIDIVLGQELERDIPWAWTDDLVDPFDVL